ncbi:MAG: hypothetical protein GEU90_13760 [Gemmatimonas sp.]|nr:hypothetical protein [Gemmatimonas sp.]
MTQTNLVTLGEFWEAWDAAMPRFTSEEQRAGILLLRELAQGEPVSMSRFAQALEVPAGEAEALLRNSALKRWRSKRSEHRLDARRPAGPEATPATTAPLGHTTRDTSCGHHTLTPNKSSRASVWARQSTDSHVYQLSPPFSPGGAVAHRPEDAPKRPAPHG